MSQYASSFLLSHQFYQPQNQNIAEKILIKSSEQINVNIFSIRVCSRREKQNQHNQIKESEILKFLFLPFIIKNQVYQMEALKKLHRLLKEDQSLKQLIGVLEKYSQTFLTRAPQQFAVSEEHEIIVAQLQKVKITGVQQAFRQLPPIPEITAIILKSSKEFTLAFLMIPQNKCFGWHDHANMNGISRCISGELIIKSLNPAHLQAIQGTNNQLCYPIERIRQEHLSPKGQKISIIYPDSFNIHEIFAKRQSCFIDLLIPEYPDNSCHYFRTIHELIPQPGDQDKLKLRKIKECYEEIIGLESLVKMLKEKEKLKLVVKQTKQIRMN